MMADPSSGKILYRPVRPTIVPDKTEVTSRPSTSGNVCSPDAVAVVPCTYCR